MGIQSQSQDLEHDGPPGRVGGQDAPRQVKRKDVADRSPASGESRPKTEAAPQPDPADEPPPDTFGNESDII
jgi:hypothetical protein